MGMDREASTQQAEGAALDPLGPAAPDPLT